VSRAPHPAVNLLLVATFVSCSPGDTHLSTEEPSLAAVTPVHPLRTSGLVPDGPRFSDQELTRSWTGSPQRNVAPATPWPEAPSPVAGYLPKITGARFAPLHEGEVQAAIDALPAERRVHGLSGLSATELYGEDNDGVCQYPHVLFEVEEAGQTWEADVLVPPAMWLLDGPEVDRYELSPDCVDTLAEQGNTDVVDPGGPCTAEDERAHFPPGSACRTCLDVDGDHPRCVEEAACPLIAPRQIQGYSPTQGRDTWTFALRARTVFCAPDILADVTILIDSLDASEGVPGPFTHDRFEAICVEAWSESQQAPGLFCTQSEAGGATIADVLVGEVAHFAPEGADRGALFHRTAVFDALEVDGHTFTATWLYEGTIGTISQPLTAPLAWGFAPYELRPDGTDAEDPEHLQARTWLAGLALKTASHRNQIPVIPFDHNRCLEEAWAERDDGTFRCAEVGPWSTDGARDDGMLVWWDEAEGQVLSFPWVTLASSGLPDPSLPGGFLTHVLGSTTLADPDWEGCSWPETFEPDVMPLHDSAPAFGRDPYASMDGQTIRFDRAPGDLRLGLSTLQRREFCPVSPR
jgi:hypothetical protein